MILDYKTGSARTEKQVRTGLAPQLTLEAAILRQGGFSASIARYRAAVRSSNRLCRAERRRTGRRINADRLQGRHARQPGRSRARKARRRWCSASTTRTSRIARSSIRCGGHVTATTTISRASRNGRATGGQKTISRARHEYRNEARHEIAGINPADVLRLQSEASDPGISAWVAANAGSGKTHVLAQRVINLAARGRRAGKNSLPHLHQGRRRQHGEAGVRYARALDHA